MIIPTWERLMPGPLPDPDAERRNTPTIPTTKLPAGGRRGPVPKLPAWIALGMAGRAWWQWAWRTPQACAWDDGQVVKIAHRATLEDDLAAVQRVDMGDFLKDVANSQDAREVKLIVAHLAALTVGRLSILTKIADIDDRLGLSPKGRDNLRWKVVSDEDYYPKKPATATARRQQTAKVSKLADRRRRVTDAS